MRIDNKLVFRLLKFVMNKDIDKPIITFISLCSAHFCVIHSFIHSFSDLQSHCIVFVFDGSVMVHTMLSTDHRHQENYTKMIIKTFFFCLLLFSSIHFRHWMVPVGIWWLWKICHKYRLLYRSKIYAIGLATF